MQNVVTAVFSGCNPTFAAATPMSWQWDTGQILKIEGLKLHTGVQAHFTISGESVTQVISVSGGCGYVTIPNGVFYEPGACMVYIYFSEDDATAETEYQIMITILERPQPEDYSDPTPAEETLFQSAIDAVEAAQEIADAAAIAAESWAVGGTGTRAGEDYNNSRFWAEMAAEQAAEGGFVYFEIRYPGDLIMVRSDNLDDDIDFDINDAGDLEVELYE